MISDIALCVCMWVVHGDSQVKHGDSQLLDLYTLVRRKDNYVIECLVIDMRFWLIDWLCWGLTTRQPLRVILCRLPEKGRKEIEERVEEMKERDREERGTGMKVKKQKK